MRAADRALKASVARKPGISESTIDSRRKRFGTDAVGRGPPAAATANGDARLKKRLTERHLDIEVLQASNSFASLVSKPVTIDMGPSSSDTKGSMVSSSQVVISLRAHAPARIKARATSLRGLAVLCIVC